MRAALVAGACLLLAACASAPKPTTTPSPSRPADAPAGSATPAALPAESPAPVATPQVQGDHIVCVPSREHDLSDYRSGGLYAPGVRDGAPPTPVDVSGVREPTPRVEPRSRYGNRDYQVLGKSYRVMGNASGHRERGIASWYGYKFHGRTTSSMEIYDMCAFSAAHKTLPLPSYVRVTNLDNGRSVVVRVNDRGPFHAGRIIDLSYAAAARLDMTRRGTANVEIEVIESAEGTASTAGERTAATSSLGPSSAATMPALDSAALLDRDGEDRWIQAGSFADKDNAERLQARLRAAEVDEVDIDRVEVGGRTLYRVRIGPLSPRQERQTRERLRDMGIQVAR